MKVKRMFCCKNTTSIQIILSITIRFEFEKLPSVLAKGKPTWNSLVKFQ